MASSSLEWSDSCSTVVTVKVFDFYDCSLLLIVKVFDFYDYCFIVIVKVFSFYDCSPNFIAVLSVITWGAT